MNGNISTAAPSVSDGERALHEAILNRLSHPELLEKAHYLMELNSNQARTIGELQDLVEVATAQPAAPQGVAYAELPDGSGNLNLYADPPAKHLVHGGARFYNFHQLCDFADRTHALRASNGQAPAGAADNQRELLEDAAFLLRKYRRLCVEIGRGDSQHLDRIEAAAVAVRALYAEPTPTAQAAPAAGAVAGLQDAGKLGRPCKVGGPCVASATSACACSELADTASNNAAAPTPAAQADSVLEDAARWRTLMSLPGASRRIWNHVLDDDVKVNANSIREALDAARKQGGKHDNP